MANIKEYEDITPENYIKQQPIERQVALDTLQQAILKNLLQGFKEQKGFIAHYHLGIYTDKSLLEWFVKSRWN